MLRKHRGLSPQDIERIRARFAEHTPSERRSISWHMAKRQRQEDGREVASIFYAYSVTWTPGTLVVAGDIGDLTVNHWHAMKTVEDAMWWLNGIHFDYFMSKTTQKQEFDADATVLDIITFANESAIESLKAKRDEWRDYRRSLVDDPDPSGEHAPEPLKVRDGGIHPRKLTRQWEVPDGWRLWHRLQQEVADWLEPDSIFTIEGRSRIKGELLSAVQDANDAADLCSRIGLDDYYGAYLWTPRQRALFEAVMAWHAKVSPPYLEKPRKQSA